MIFNAKIKRIGPYTKITKLIKINFIRVVDTLALLGHQTSHSQNTFFFLVTQYTIFN